MAAKVQRIYIYIKDITWNYTSKLRDPNINSFMGYLSKWRAAVNIGWLANWKLVRNLSRPNWRHYLGIFLRKTSGITVVMRVESRTANLPIQARSSIAWDSLLNPNTTIDLFLDVTPCSFVHRNQHCRATWASVQVHTVTSHSLLLRTANTC